MGRRKTDLEERILRTADHLFYRRGYTNTGVSQIVQEAGTNKPGLYSYFDGKDELARRYVSDRNEAMTADIIALGGQSTDVVDFFRRWMMFTKDEAVGRGGSLYNGCAVANFALQTEAENEPMQAFIRTLGRRWAARLTAYIRAEMRAGKFPSKPGAAAIAQRMLVCNEGAITMWKLTGNAVYFDEAVRMFEAGLRAL